MPDIHYLGTCFRVGYLGGDGFRTRLLKMVQRSLGKGLPASFAGPAKREHGLAEAERTLAAALKTLGVTTRQLTDGGRQMPAKLVLAWWLRQRTTVGRHWVAERLSLGDESAVSHACRSVKQRSTAEMDRLRQRLLKAVEDEGEPQARGGEL